MPLTNSQLVQLKTELNTDPNGYGYAADLNSGNDAGLVAKLNLRRATIRVKRDDVSASEIFHAVAVTDLVTNPGASQLEYLNALIQAPFPVRLLNDDGSATPVRTNVISLFKSGTASLTRLAALETRDGSRVEDLFGRGVSVSDVDVANAKKLP